jgi:large subunit ribosomal protein L21
MFEVFEIAGKQYIAEPGKTIVVDRIDGEAGTTVIFDRVFLVSDGKDVKVGTPTVTGKKVTAKIEKQFKGEKIDVRRYKQKVRSRRHIGFRALETELSIVSIG